MLTQHAEHLTGRSIVGSLSEFQNNWREFTKGMFAGLDWNNVLVAGGAVLGRVEVGALFYFSCS